jgi:hypothetical protein
MVQQPSYEIHKRTMISEVHTKMSWRGRREGETDRGTGKETVRIPTVYRKNYP